MTTRATLFRLLAAAAMAAGFLACATAQEAFPAKTITLVSPGQAGSTNDVTARIVAQQMSTSLGIPVVIENKPGAGGAIAMQYVAKARPDGHTLVIVVGSTAVVPQAVTKVMAYDMKDFAPVSMITTQPMVLLVSKDAKIDSVKDLVGVAKASPGKTSYGNSSTMSQMAMELFNQQAGTDILGINYKGPGDAATDMIGGRLQVMPDSLGSATPRIQSGRVKAIAILGPHRLPAFADVPTMAELGYKNMEFEGWGGIMAPAGTPLPILRKLSAEIRKAVFSEPVKKQFATLMVEPVATTPEEFGELLSRETARYEKMARDARMEKQ